MDAEWYQTVQQWEEYLSADTEYKQWSENVGNQTQYSQETEKEEIKYVVNC